MNAGADDDLLGPGSGAVFSRRDLLRAGAAMGAGAGMAQLGLAPARRRQSQPGAWLAASGTAKGLGPGGSLLRPGSRPYPHLPPGTDSLPKLEHIVVLMMENHSFDDHLGMLGRGDGLTLGSDRLPVNYNPDPTGGYVSSFHMPNTSATYAGISQSWDASHISWNHGTNMGFVKACGPVSMGYWTGADFPFYYGMAKQFPIGDRYFCSVMAQTYPNRRFLIAATALGDVSTNSTGISATDAPNGTIFDTFDRYGISWKEYYPDYPTCGLFLPVFERASANGNLSSDVNEFVTNAREGKLPAFSLVDPYTNYSEESGDMSIGEAYAARIINAVLRSPKWQSTALIWVYDEHGGWFDHVPPQPAVKPDDVPPEIDVPPDQPGAYDYTGFRVPCCVISAWSRRDYVSHQVFDHTSILKLLETKWNLPALTYRDANARNMLDFFDFDADEPPFAEPPTLPAPLNPFVGPLPLTSLGAHPKGFHTIASPAPAGALPSAHFRTSEPPKDAATLIAEHTRKALGLATSAPGGASHHSGTGGGWSAPAVIGGVAGGVVLAGAAVGLGLGMRRRGRRLATASGMSEDATDSPRPPI